MKSIIRMMPPGESPLEVELGLKRVRVGRSQSNDIVLGSPQVSSAHLELVQRDDGIWLQDKDSTNGTKVNGKRVQEVLLKDGDEILIGTSVAAEFFQKTAADSSTPVKVDAEAAGGDSIDEVASVKPAESPLVAKPSAPGKTPAARPDESRLPEVAAPMKTSEPEVDPEAAPEAAKPRVAIPAAALKNKLAAPVAVIPESRAPKAAPTVVVKKTAEQEVPKRPPIKIAKPQPPAASSTTGD